jgi:hypothetical protein
MTEATMQSTVLTKQNYKAKKNHSEISEHDSKKLKFLLNKTKESEIFETEFYLTESISDSKIREIKSCEFLDSYAKKWIDQAKKEFTAEVETQSSLMLEFGV